MNSTLHIKNMVCPRCIKVVKDEFNKLNIPVNKINLGIVETTVELNAQQIKTIRIVLEKNGFELIDNKKSKLIESIKNLIIEKIHHSQQTWGVVNTSDFISQKLGYDYSYLSNLFSSVEGTTIEKYIIAQKIEKAKELLVYDELTLNEISYLLGYSSVQHLSSQFKRTTGLTPSHFKKLRGNKRKSLDEI